MSRNGHHPAAFSVLRDGFGGAIHRPEDPGYEDARSIFNSMIEKRPSLIAQVSGADDIRQALAFAGDNDLEVAVRGGGHSVAGACLTDGGVTIDLRRMNNVTVDPPAKTATAQGGALWADFDRATQPHNLMAPGGRVSTTGVAGLTLGGGSCWLERRFGMACDNLVSVELITADGRAVCASEDENQELFWALHGGGGNFGIATELTFRLHDLPAATFGLLVWPAEAGPEVNRAYRELLAHAPEELGGCALYTSGPPAEFVPEHLQNELVCMPVVYYAGPEAEAREVVAPLLALEPAGVLLAEMPYADMQCAIDDPPGYRNWWSAEYLPELSDEALGAYDARSAQMPVPSPSLHTAMPLGGAVTRNADLSPLAFRREAKWTIHPLALWEDPADDEQAIGWARGVIGAMKPHSLGAVYPNFIGDEGQSRVAAAYGPDNYRRLAEVKAEFDPDDVFHLHHGIEPLARV
ncbi:MAG TPA: FAD-binding oxidoreductase [Solirubrobacterales bacterium]|nr:FAD-binding oxidoreductase [Solirubrobacterales bacterium]